MPSLAATVLSCSISSDMNGFLAVLRTAAKPAELLFQHFFGLLISRLLDLLLIPLEEGLHLLLAFVALVLGHFLAFLGLFEVLVGVAANIADGNLGLLGQLLDARDHLLALFAAHGRHGQADQ